jgi:hypothetical protein
MAVPGAQLAFYGSRRLKGGSTVGDPAPSLYKYYEKNFKIQMQFQLTQAYNTAVPLLSQIGVASVAGGNCSVVGSRVFNQIQDFDFELRHLVKYCEDGNGNPVAGTSPFAVVLYDSVMVARMNYPALAEFLFDDLVTPNGRNWWPSPPIMYPVNTNVAFDIYGTLNSSVVLPVTVTILLDGVRRVPCG